MSPRNLCYPTAKMALELPFRVYALASALGAPASKRAVACRHLAVVLVAARLIHLACHRTRDPGPTMQCLAVTRNRQQPFEGLHESKTEMAEVNVRPVSVPQRTA